MSRANFIFLVIVGVLCLCSMTTAQPKQCPANQVWNSCGTACPPSCSNPHPEVCTMQCVIGCQCVEGYLLNASQECVTSLEC